MLKYWKSFMKERKIGVGNENEDERFEYIQRE